MADTLPLCAFLPHDLWIEVLFYRKSTHFDKLYDKFRDAEKKEFLSSFVERVDIYEDELPDGRFLRHIKFKFPVFYNGQEIDEMSWDKESTVETVCLLSKLKY